MPSSESDNFAPTITDILVPAPGRKEEEERKEDEEEEEETDGEEKENKDS